MSAYARTTDPTTSHVAASSVNVTEKEAIVYKAIKVSGANGATWDEIARTTGIDKATVSPRFKPLREKGLIEAKMIDGETVVRKGNSSRGQTVWIAK